MSDPKNFEWRVFRYDINGLDFYFGWVIAKAGDDFIEFQGDGGSGPVYFDSAEDAQRRLTQLKEADLL
jgi:hypothetical protein